MNKYTLKSKKPDHFKLDILFPVPIQKGMGEDFFPYLIKGAWRSMYIIDRKSGNPII